MEVLFIFKRGTTYYLVNAESKEDAWNRLQKRLSWNVDIVKQQCQLIKTMNETDSITTLK